MGDANPCLAAQNVPTLLPGHCSAPKGGVAAVPVLAAALSAWQGKSTLASLKDELLSDAGLERCFQA